MPETAEAKSLETMMTEVDDYCRKMGWRENPVTFGEAMALLHSEVAEASDAWRRWGLTDATVTFEPGSVGAVDAVLHPPKPEGVGSEFADIYIRWLDDAVLFNVDIAAGFPHGGLYLLHPSFLENMNGLHTLIARVSSLYLMDSGAFDWHIAFAGVLVYLRQCCETCGIDLQAEYERKMAYNRQRPYRHGGKRQ